MTSSTSNLPPEVYQHRPRVIWKLHRALHGLRTSPKMWQEHLNATLRDMQLHQLKSDRCIWVKKNIIVLAYVDDLLIAGTSRDTALFLEQLRQSFSLKHSTVLTSQQPLRFLGKRICRHPNGDITVSLERSYYYSMLKNMDLDDNSNPTSTPSLQRPPVQQDSQLDPDRHHIYRKVVGMLIWAQVRPDLQFTAKDHTRHLSAPTEWDWTHLKHTLRYIKGTMHYKFLISPRLPQGHSLPLRQLIPLNINTYCDSDWATDIDSQEVYLRHSYLSTSSTSCFQQQNTEYSRYIISRSRTLCHWPRHQRQPTHLPATSRTSTSSSKAYLRLRQPRDTVQHCHLNNNKTTDINKITDSHLHRQYISTQPQQQAWPQQKVQAHRLEIPLCSGHPGHWACEHPESYITQQSGRHLHQVCHITSSGATSSSQWHH